MLLEKGFGEEVEEGGVGNGQHENDGTDLDLGQWCTVNEMTNLHLG